MSDPVLTMKLVMHGRLQGGALYAYDVYDGEKKIGSKTVTLNKKANPWTDTAIYRLGDQEFTSGGAFIAAYKQKCRDDEWDAAAPQEEQK